MHDAQFFFVLFQQCRTKENDSTTISAEKMSYFNKSTKTSTLFGLSKKTTANPRTTCYSIWY